MLIKSELFTEKNFVYNFVNGEKEVLSKTPRIKRSMN